jgi:hypothetical protein
MSRTIYLLVFLFYSIAAAGEAPAQEASVDPGIKDFIRDPDVPERAGRFEVESQEGEGPAAGVGRGRGRGAGRGRGPGPAMRADQEVLHFLLARHTEIDRTVKRLDNGVETLTESEQPHVAEKIQEHVAAMHKRVQEGRGLRYWDDLFVEIFKRHASIKMSVEKTDKGVRVTETSDDPIVVALIQAHAEIVSKFVAQGFEEAHRNHPVPPAAKAQLVRPPEGAAEGH